jgi:DNA helicase-2/ATP-dependent DNA helicase PcrA
MRIVCDFHVHSKYAQATSKYADLVHYAEGAKKKGVDVVGSGDVLHPKWRREVKENIMKENKEVDEERGIYKFKGVYFLLSTEVCTQEEREGKIRRVHHVIHFPSFEIVEQVADALSCFGSLEEDGRPLLRISPAHLVEIIKNISKDVEIYPAHAWTPWFGVLGSKSGYKSIEHAYEDKAHFIWALETGLSSDPPMNWMVSSLDKYVFHLQEVVVLYPMPFPSGLW